MHKDSSGIYTVTRDEVRLFKTAASMSGDAELSTIYSHFLAARLSGVERLKLVTQKECIKDIVEEVGGLDRVYSRPAGNYSADNLRYHYGPIFMAASVDVTARAMNENRHHLKNSEVALGAIVLENYDTLQD